MDQTRVIDWPRTLEARARHEAGQARLDAIFTAGYENRLANHRKQQAELRPMLEQRQLPSLASVINLVKRPFRRLANAA